MDPDADPDPAIFVSDLQDVNKVFLLINFLRYIYIIFQRYKVIKKSQNSRNQCFSYYFCLMIEGSGSGKPKNIWIHWIKIRIRIRNTAVRNYVHKTLFAIKLELFILSEVYLLLTSKRSTLDLGPSSLTP
jgi:hypothetical protein